MCNFARIVSIIQHSSAYSTEEAPKLLKVFSTNHLNAGLLHRKFTGNMIESITFFKMLLWDEGDGRCM